MDIRIGHGIDSHRFLKKAGKKLVLAGVEIPGAAGFVSHSDGDVIYHALTDALIGACGLEGDIGTFFPNTDSRFQNQDSSLFLKKILEIVWEKQYRVSNVDINIISEKIKISPFRASIRQNIAGHCNLPADRVAVKAKSAEKMGALGRGEGMLATATVLLYKDL